MEIFLCSINQRAKHFLKELSLCLPRNRQVTIIMDAGFYEEWFKEIEALGWHCRIRGTKAVKLSEAHEWKTIKELAAIIQITYWVEGVIAHSQNKQQYFKPYRQR